MFSNPMKIHKKKSSSFLVSLQRMYLSVLFPSNIQEPYMHRAYERNIRERLRKCCCLGKAISITYSECVSVALVIQYEMRSHQIVICGLLGSTIFVNGIS